MVNSNVNNYVLTDFHAVLALSSKQRKTLGAQINELMAVFVSEMFFNYYHIQW